MNMLQVIRKGAYGSMPDSQLTIEHNCQKRLFAAWAEFKAAAEDVNAGSSVKKIDMNAVEAFEHDEMPSMRQWDEAISEARQI